MPASTGRGSSDPASSDVDTPASCLFWLLSPSDLFSDVISIDI